MSLFRMLSIASLCLTIVGQIVAWSGNGESSETSAEIAMLMKTFGGGSAAADKHDGKSAAASSPDQPDPAALLAALLK